MPRLLGERYLPQSVMSARRRLREQVNDLREPVKQRREDLVPGPDLIGRVEGMVDSTRRDILAREGFGLNMMDLRNDENDVEEEEEVENGNDNNNGEPTPEENGADDENTITI